MTRRRQHQRNSALCECGLLYCTNCHDACPECLGIHVVTETPPQVSPELEWTPPAPQVVTPFHPPYDFGTYTDPDLGSSTDPGVGNVTMDLQKEEVEPVLFGPGTLMAMPESYGPRGKLSRSRVIKGERGWLRTALDEARIDREAMEKIRTNRAARQRAREESDPDLIAWRNEVGWPTEQIEKNRAEADIDPNLYRVGG